MTLATKRRCAAWKSGRQKYAPATILKCIVLSASRLRSLKIYCDYYCIRLHVLGDRHKSLIVYSASASAQVKHSTRNSDFLVVFYKTYFICNKTALAADGSKVLAVGRAGVKSYNTETGDCLRSLPAHKVLVTHTNLLQRNFSVHVRNSRTSCGSLCNAGSHYVSGMRSGRHSICDWRWRSPGQYLVG